jgi:hypothetical protein
LLAHAVTTKWRGRVVAISLLRQSPGREAWFPLCRSSSPPHTPDSKEETIRPTAISQPTKVTDLQPKNLRAKCQKQLTDVPCKPQRFNFEFDRDALDTVLPNIRRAGYPANPKAGYRISG